MSQEIDILKVIEDDEGKILGITGSPSTTIDITIDIKEESKLGRILGQMVHFVVEEEENPILVIGQVISIETQNRWHQDPTFKGVIRLHGNLPHLSGRADNRVATISVQAAYSVKKETNAQGHVLGTSPSTGLPVKKMSNPLMSALMRPHEKYITYMGHVYGTDVNLPFWFRHFDKGDGGAGDAHHIGVFGKTGSGKSVTAAYMLLGYAKNKENMNILVLDPQAQFYYEKDFPPLLKMKNMIEKCGMTYIKYHLLQELYLPGDEHELFASMLQKNRFIQKAFNIKSDRELDAGLAVAEYLASRFEKSRGSAANMNRLDRTTSKKLMTDLLNRFVKTDSNSDSNKYIDSIYTSRPYKNKLMDHISRLINAKEEVDALFSNYWHPIVKYFQSKSDDGVNKKPIDEVINLISDKDHKGNIVILDISGEQERLGSENVKALFVRLIEGRIKEVGQRYYAEGQKVNCLIVMDEAHRYISRTADDPQIQALTHEIIDSVRTTRKFGIGYMFITQTIESLDKEILQQTRIFAFGYGLTLGTEMRVIGNIVNNDSAMKLYRSFIDPGANNRYPFMFYGSVSPLSFTGAPLFLEVYTNPGDFR